LITPQKHRQEVADDILFIFYASSKKKALEFYEQFKKRWGNIPSAVFVWEDS